jgi:hypothetical protein
MENLTTGRKERERERERERKKKRKIRTARRSTIIFNEFFYFHQHTRVNVLVISFTPQNKTTILARKIL